MERQKYKITNYTKRRAKQWGVEVRPSTRKNKKIDVFKNGTKIASVGALGMGDYPTFIATRGKRFAESRRRLYKQRHSKDRFRKNTPGFYADQLLW